MTSAAVDRYVVMGNPVAHSKSPLIHTLFARQTAQNILYEPVLVERQHFAAALDAFQRSGGRGANITVPFKQEAWELVNRLSPRADRAGAVNTIVFDQSGERFGDNTDGVGLLRDLQTNHGFSLEGKHVLLLGAGGAVRGVLGTLLENKPASVIIANRTPENAIRLADEFNTFGVVAGMGFDDIETIGFDLIINGTSTSLHGEVLPISATTIGPNSWCYDMMYSKEPTAFMRWALMAGAARVIDGLGMLVEQAAEAFFIWRGVRPETRPVIKAVRENLAASR